MDKKIEEKIGYVFGGTLIVFCLTFAIVYPKAVDVGYETDYLTHAQWAMDLNTHIFSYMSKRNPYPLWHIVVRSLYKFFSFSVPTSVAGATALFNCIAFWSIIYAWDFLSNKSTTLRTKVFWAICILWMGPLYAPGFNERYYLGQGTGNIWHNPTHIAVKGFAVLCFVWIVRLVNQDVEHRKWEYFLLSIFLFLSALAKPSFIQVMIPGLGMYFIYDLLSNKGDKARLIHFCRIAATFIPSVALLGVQLIIVYFSPVTSMYGERGIGVAYGSVLSEWSDNLFISLLLTLAFPIFVFLINVRGLLKDNSVIIAFFYGLCGWLEAAFLYEDGNSKMQANLTWGWSLSLLIIWMLSVIKYLDIIRDETISSKKRIVCLCLGMPILFFHVVFGIGYFIALSHGYTVDIIIT